MKLILAFLMLMAMPIMAQANNTTTVPEVVTVNLSDIFAPSSTDIACLNTNDTFVINCALSEETKEACEVLGLDYTLRFESQREADGDVINVLFIENFDNNIIDQRDWTLPSNEVTKVSFTMPFSCPSEVITDINLNTCSAFFDEFISKDEPLLFTLAKGTQQCNDLLAQCTTNLGSEKAVQLSCEKDRVTLRDQVIENTDKFNKCERDLNAPDGICQIKVNSERDFTDLANERANNLVSVWYQYGFILLILMLAGNIVLSGRW